MLRLHDTRSGQAEQIEPARRGQLRVFACGPPAGRQAHVGDLRTAALADLIRRAAHRHRLSVLVAQGSNDVGTRVDDARGYADALLADCSALNIRPPDYSSRASESIAPITDMIASLVSGSHAYAASGGSVYFDARSFPGYGDLSGHRLDDLPPETVPPPPRRFAADWPLWTGLQGDSEPGWAAPWGRGLPGPDIACSAMSLQHLGDVIDIHTGGIDLCFPHHENERAQSDSAAGHEVVRHWVHGGPVLFEGHEMTGPDGPGPDGPGPDGPTLADLTQRGLDPLALRLAFLEHRYREPLDLTWPGLADADRILRGWREQVADWATHPSRPVSAEHVTQMSAAFDDDLDTPAAIAALRALASAAEVPPGAKFETFAHVDQLFGLDLAREVGRPPARVPLPAGAEGLLAERDAARESRDWASAGRLAEELARRGVTVTDTPGGQHWTVERDL